MKKLLFLLSAVLFCTAVMSQTVTIRFEGKANANSKVARNYMVDINGQKYYSSDAVGGDARAKQLVVNNLATGTHNLTVFEIDDSGIVSSDALYSNTFRLRTGYDMVVAVRRNGTIAFSEKKMSQTSGLAGTSAGASMSEAEFNKLHKSVKAKWSQSSRVSAIKTAVANKAYSFTTEQVGELLLLVTSEANRLQLAKLAYPKVTDPANFADIKDLFNAEANRNDLANFIESKNTGSLSSTNVYASRIAMSDSEFSKLYTKANLHFRQSSVVKDVKAALSNKNNYFTQEQIRSLLSLVGTEAERLSLAKLAYHRAADPTTFTQLFDLFTTQASIDALNNYIRLNRS